MILIGNFLTQTNKDYPLDCEGLGYIQQNIAMLQVIGNLAGDKAILTGCEPEQNGSARAAGYVFLRTNGYPDGEVLYWEGGNISAGMYIKLKDISIEAEGYDYPKAWTQRTLAPGVGTENYSWNDFKDVKTVQQLADKDKQQDAAIAALAPPPLGIVQMWAGNTTAGAFPDNYRYCDGSQLAAADYPELYAVIGRLHTPVGIPSGYFCLPDLRSRFIVGYNPNDSDYNSMAKAGGSKTVTLSTNQIPEHTHEAIGGSKFVTTTGTTTPGGGGDGGRNCLQNGKVTLPTTTAGTGGNAAHENRPPYYTLAFIMRVK